MKKTKKALILTSALATTALCASLVTGATFALFTSESGVDIAVTAGKVNVTASIDDLATTSLGEVQTPGSWANGGTAIINGNKVTLDKITPGDSVSFNIKVDNTDTNVAAKYRVAYNVKSGYMLAEGLDVVIGNYVTAENKYKNYTGAWTDWSDSLNTIAVTVTLPNHEDSTLDNMYKGLTTEMSFAVEAVQANGVPAESEATFEELPNFDNAKQAAREGMKVAPVSDAKSFLEQMNKESDTNYIVLEDDVKVNTQEGKTLVSPILKDCVFDLNGKILTTDALVAAPYLNKDGKGINVTIKNGTINATIPGISYQGINSMGDDVVFTLEDVNIYVDGGTQAVYMAYGDKANIYSGKYELRNLLHRGAGKEQPAYLNYYVDLDKKVLIDVNKKEYEFTEMEFVYLPEKGGVAIKGTLKEGVELLDGAYIGEDGYLYDRAKSIGIVNRMAINLRDNDGSVIKIYGGSFKNFNPANNVSENPKVSHVAEGYSVVYKKDEKGDYWFTVVPDAEVESYVANGYTQG